MIRVRPGSAARAALTACAVLLLPGSGLAQQRMLTIDEIYDPDLIYPGQVLQIERDLSQTQINIAVNHAKTRGAWVLGEIEATDIQYLRKALSW